MHDRFRRFANQVSTATGSPVAFALAVSIIVGWALTGPVFGFSDTWQLVINTGTTIVTFIMVFLIQNTQNRDARAIYIKLDELLRSVQRARIELVDLEQCSDDDLDSLKEQFRNLRERAERQRRTHGPGAPVLRRMSTSGSVFTVMPIAVSAALAPARRG